MSFGGQALQPTERVKGEVLFSSAAYSDRICGPDETLVRVQPFLTRFGITRLADQTGLDRIGIPCFASFRPNAATIATNQGKGLSRAAAKVSAAMEALECAVAEHPPVQHYLATAAQWKAQAIRTLEFSRFLPAGAQPPDVPLLWVKGVDVATGETVVTPLDTVDIDTSRRDLPGVCKTTNGLASGNTNEEAVFHALCELVERDAGTLWALGGIPKAQATALAPAAFADPAIIALSEQIQKAGLVLRLFDQTSDLSVPTIMALIGDPSSSVTARSALAAGYGSHPNPVRAALRAITEAAQTRVTTIAGARDDIEAQFYTEESDGQHANLLALEPSEGRKPPQGVGLGATLQDLLAMVREALTRASIKAYVFQLTDETVEFSVVKVLAPDLEDREANAYWRPGPRAQSLLAGK